MQLSGWCWYFFFLLLLYRTSLYVHDLALTRKYLFLLFPFMLLLRCHDVHWIRFRLLLLSLSPSHTSWCFVFGKTTLFDGPSSVTCGREVESNNILTSFRLSDAVLLPSCIYDLWRGSASESSVNLWCTRTNFRPIKTNW